MGLLDDAIREHLDLKRRRGADPTEVERAEQEALGPVRRNREVSVASDPDDEALADGSLAYDQAAQEEDWNHASGDERERSIAEEADLPPLELTTKPRRLPRLRRREPASSSDERAVSDSALNKSASDDPAGTPHPGPEPPARVAADPSGPETVEHELEEPHAGEHQPDDDMLEETPEFLQDTPDHDRLWFEQRPPKDFDFNG